MASTALNIFADVFNRLDGEPTKIIRELYTDNILFVDPIHRIEGIEALEKYMEGLYRGVESCKFDFSSPMQVGDEAWYPWKMRLRHPKVHKHGPVVVPGVSHLRIAGDKISYHQDFFDMGAMIYEHVPALGFFVRKIKERM